MKAIRIVLVIFTAMYTFFAIASSVCASELHTVASQGDVSKVKLLLSKGKKVDERDEHALTPLHYASAFAKLEVVKYLVAKGANVNSQDERGKTSLHYAAAADMTLPLSGQPFGTGAGFGMLMLDAQFTDVVEFLLSKRAKSNIADKEGLTPLHEIAASSTKGINAEKRAKALLDAGADRSLKDNRGRTPYELALEGKNQSIVDILAEVHDEQQVTTAAVPGTKSSVSSKTVDIKKSDMAFVNNVISDYLTLIVWIINRDNFSTAEVWKTGRDLLDTHHFEGAKAKGTIAVPESFEAVLISSGLVALKFRAVWVDPLPSLVDSRGDFPPIQVRNGSVSPLDDKVRLRIDIGDGTEVMVDGVGYIYKSGQWHIM